MSFYDILQPNCPAPYWANIHVNSLTINGPTGCVTFPPIVPGPTGPTGTIANIVVKKGSGTGDYTLVSSDGMTAASIDANLDYTTVIPLGYKLTVDVLASVVSTDYANFSYLFIYDGGTNGSGGTLISAISFDGNNGGANQVLPTSLHGVINGDGNSHHIQFMGFSSSSGTQATVRNNTYDNILLVPQTFYRLESSF